MAARAGRSARSRDEREWRVSGTPGTRRDTVMRGVLLIDSITQLEPGDAGLIAISGSHGGQSSARYALAVPMRLVVFNDAGVGKDGAGIAALALMQDAGRAALAVAHDTARIGDAHDHWDAGVISHVNEAAAALGLAPGQPLREALMVLLKRQGPAEAGPP
jgi:hypothetical protein